MSELFLLNPRPATYDISKMTLIFTFSYFALLYLKYFLTH